MPNRLAGETSPYLLQHQHNPVDWWPWSREAFLEAAERDVPVFLSVGYSTCYWCHVMERQVFENEAIARQMNAGFVNIKVDREERPDVDEHYMTATQVLTGQGGWPMSVFLTPRGEPFFAGTYFPPEDQHGRPGFPRVLEALAQAWRDRRADIEQTVGTLRGILQRLGEPAPPGETVTFNEGLLVELALRSAADYDPRHGGFGGAPKFPRQTLLEMLLAARAAFGEHLPQIDRPLRHTLDAMANGGIRDHLGGGFHRYSTDAKWLVPHFEIMLYDQALLAWCYAEAARQFGAQRYGRVARGICDFVLREMTDASGAFYTAFDAEVDASEGSSYLWTPPEVKAVLGPNDAELFSEVYGLDQGFNFADPHGPLPDSPDRNVLFLAKPQLEDDPRIIAMRARLKAARDARKQPLLDTKIITSWNGLMIRSLAHAGEALGEPRYTAAAHKAADWLWREHRTEDGMLIHSSRREAAHFAGGVTGAHAQRISGFLDDYAFLGLGLLAMAKRSKPSGGLNWQQRAAQIADYLAQHFADEQHGGFFFSDVSHDDLGDMTGVRRKIGADSPSPAGNAAAALLMLELDRPEPCRRTLEVFAGQIVDHVGNTSALLEAAIRYYQAQGPISISGSPAAQSEDQAVVEIAGAAWETPQRLAVRLRIADGYHVYAEDAEHAQALALSSPHAAFTRTHAPPAREGQYRGEVRFVLEFSAPVNRETVDVSLRYQACDESRCLLPVSQQLHVAPGQP